MTQFWPQKVIMLALCNQKLIHQVSITVHWKAGGIVKDCCFTGAIQWALRNAKRANLQIVLGAQSKNTIIVNGRFDNNALQGKHNWENVSVVDYVIFSTPIFFISIVLLYNVTTQCCLIHIVQSIQFLNLKTR